MYATGIIQNTTTFCKQQLILTVPKTISAKLSVGYIVGNIVLVVPTIGEVLKRIVCVIICAYSGSSEYNFSSPFHVQGSSFLLFRCSFIRERVFHSTVPMLANAGGGYPFYRFGIPFHGQGLSVSSFWSSVAWAWIICFIVLVIGCIKMVVRSAV